MDFVHPINSQKKKKHGKRCIFAILITFGMLLLSAILLLCLLPTLLSTPAVRERVLAIVNEKMAPASLSIESWSLAWFQQQTLSNITYTDPIQKINASVSEIQLNSLWELLPIGKIEADLCINAPELSIPLPEYQSKSRALPPPIVKKSADTPPEVATPPQCFVLPAWDIAFNLTIHQAKITTPTRPDPLLQKGELTLSIPALNEPIQAALSALLLDAELKTDVTTTSLEQLLSAPITAQCLNQCDLSLCAPWINLSLNTAPAQSNLFPKATLSLALDVGKTFSLIDSFHLVPEQITHATGQFALSTQLTPINEERLHLVSSITSKALALTYAGKTLTCDPALTADLLLTPTHLIATDIRQLQLSLPGVTLNGRGTLTNGTLSANIHTLPLWNTFAPFIGEYPLQRHLTTTFTAKAINQQLDLNLKTTAEQSTIGELSLTIDTLDPLQQTFKALKLSSHWTVAEVLATLCQLPKDTSVMGDLYLNLAATGAFNDLRSNLTFALQNAKVKSAAWHLQEAVLLEGKTSLTFKENSLTLSDLTLSSPIASLAGTLTSAPSSETPLTATLSGKLMPEPILNKWRIWGKDEKPLHLTGDISCSLTAQQQAEALQVTAALQSETLTLKPAESDPIQLPFTLDTTLQQAGSATTVKHCKLSTTGLDLLAEGAFVSATGMLQLKGSLTPDFDTLFTAIPQLAENRKTFAISGKHTRDFTIEAPVTQGLPGIINYGEATAEIAFDRVTVPGLDIPNGAVNLTLREGVMAIDGIIPVNEGTVQLQPRLSMMGNTPILSWAPDGKILDRVRLTQKLFDALLGALTPILSGSADPDGYLSLTCKQLHLPLVQAPLPQLNTRLLLQAQHCTLQPNGPIKNVLSTALGKSSTLQLDDSELEVNVENGVLTTSPISLRVEDLKITCQGSTHLETQAIDYTITLPLTAKVLGRTIKKTAKPGETLTLPIRGTIQQPVIDMEPLVAAFTEKAVEKAKDKLSQKLEKALKKRTEKRQKQKKTEKDAREEALENALRGLFGN